MPSSDRATIRWSTCVLLALLALVTGCERTPPPVDPANPGARPAPTVDAAAPAPSASTAFVQTISADDVRLGTEVGERVLGRGLSSTGKAGWLMFGPYIPLPAGNYQVALQGAVQEGHAGVVYVDVAQGKGAEVIAAVEPDAAALLAPASPDGLVVLPFKLASASDNIEIRIRVTEASKLSISGFVIRAVP